MVERNDPAPPRSGTRFPWRIVALAVPAVLAIVVLLPNLGPIFRTFSLPSASMSPSLPAGSVIIASRLSYGYSRYSFDDFQLPLSGRWPAAMPKRGDNIVFRLQRNRKVHYIKRVIGLPGDRIAHRDGRVILNGRPLERAPSNTKLPRDAQRLGAVQAFTEMLPDGLRYTVLIRSAATVLDNVPEVTVPAGHIYVLGDNRPNSTDSRMPSAVGFVPLDHVVAKVLTHWRP